VACKSTRSGSLVTLQGRGVGREPRCWCGDARLEEFSTQYWRCGCGTLVDRAFPEEDLTQVADQGEFYGRDYYLKHLSDDFGFPTLPERARADLPERSLYWLRMLLRYRLPPGRVLELGSAHGGFVALLLWAGFDATGLELSPWLAGFARETFGVPMLVGLVLMDVLEHLQNPTGTLGHALTLLRPDGLLVVQTPAFPEELDFAAMTATGHPFLQQLRPKDHLFLFSRRSVRELLAHLGVAHVVFEPAIFSPTTCSWLPGDCRQGGRSRATSSRLSVAPPRTARAGLAGPG
jgi:SAM-dependent methyltransferase